jgi:acyl-CoA dehydrogenase
VEVHKATLAKQMLRDYQATDALFPSYHVPGQRERALAKFREALEHVDEAV